MRAILKNKWVRIALAVTGFLFVSFLCFVFLTDLTPNIRTINENIVIDVD